MCVSRKTMYNQCNSFETLGNLQYVGIVIFAHLARYLTLGSQLEVIALR